MKNLILVSLIFFLLACQPGTKQDTEGTAVTETDSITVSLEKIWESDTVLTTAESVLFNSSDSILYVSCINGVPPVAKDGDGFIAKVSPVDGSIINLNWVTGLDAPKGMGIYDGTLYVTNINEVVMIDLAAGKISKRVAVEGAEFLNDLTIDPDGNVYISDSNTNKIHLMSSDGKLSTWIEDENMGGPNGLFHDGERMMMATFGKGNFNTIDFTDEKVQPVVESIPGGDGVVKVGVDFLVSNWNGEVYYVTSDWDKKKILDTKEMGANAADIDFIPSSATLLVPTFFGNQVVAYRLKK